MAAFVVKMSLEIAELKRDNNINSIIHSNNNNNNQEQNNQQNENNQNNVVENKELSEATKKELLSLVGLTEKGIKRTTDNVSEFDWEAAAGNPEAVNLYWLALDFIFLTIDDKGAESNKEIQINQLPVDIIKDIIRAASTGFVSERKNEFSVPDDEYDCSSEGSGLCEGLSFENYKKTAKKYNLNENGNSYFTKREIYNGYYLFDELGGIDDFAKITDSYSFERQNDNTILTYNIKLDFPNDEIGTSYDRTNFNKKFTYIFKQYDDGTYYLYSVKVVKL